MPPGWIGVVSVRRRRRSEACLRAGAIPPSSDIRRISAGSEPFSGVDSTTCWMLALLNASFTPRSSSTRRTTRVTLRVDRDHGAVDPAGRQDLVVLLQGVDHLAPLPLLLLLRAHHDQVEDDRDAQERQQRAEAVVARAAGAGRVRRAGAAWANSRGMETSKPSMAMVRDVSDRGEPASAPRRGWRSTPDPIPRPFHAL